MEISPEKIESLLLLAQVMGVPSLIRFLRRINNSLISDELRTSISPVKKPGLVYVQLPPSVQKRQVETRSLTFEQVHSYHVLTYLHAYLKYVCNYTMV